MTPENKKSVPPQEDAAEKPDAAEIERIIENTSEETQKKIDWTKAWSRKYPVLGVYQQTVDVEKYGRELQKLLGQLKAEYGYNDLDALLVLKDILGRVWNRKITGKESP